MVDLDKPYFTDQLRHFGTVHKVTVTDAMRLAYWEDLRNMEITSFARACSQLRRTSQWMPKPCEFIKAARVGWT